MQLVRCVSRRAIARHPPLLVTPKSPISSPDQAAGGVPQCQATLFECVGRSLSPKQNTAELLQSPKGARVQQTAAATRQGNRGTTLRNTSFCASTSHPPSRGISWSISRRRCAVVVVACEPLPHQPVPSSLLPHPHHPARISMLPTVSRDASPVSIFLGGAIHALQIGPEDVVCVCLFTTAPRFPGVNSPKSQPSLQHARISSAATNPFGPRTPSP